MPYLFEILLFLLPFGLYALWRRLNPGIEPGPRLVWLALAGVVLALAAAILYGLSVSMEAGTHYVPAELDSRGNVVPGRTMPSR
ncbi:MAG TPA: hypothetical protein VE684_17710 [Crenalkalicoccus sp.]|nr:hypothetical protein [Crenalkalicoccus sp.]